jgi:glycosyltransferase involved in cell wall biosynthesis/ubiquinone/menaquinone biosynthesis C-methylase UbiE
VKILQILYYAEPYVSGLTIYAGHLAREMTARGHEMTILASRHEASLQDVEVTPEGYRVKRLPVAAHLDRAVIVPTLIPTAIRLMRNVDVVHLHLPIAESAVLVAIARAMGKRVIVTHHSDLVLTEGLLTKVAVFATQWSGIIAGNLASTFVTYTKSRAAVSPTVTRVKDVTIVSPPVVIDEPSPRAREDFRARFNLGNGPVIGLASRYAVEKGIDVLLQTIPQLRKQFPNAVIAIAGPSRDLRTGEPLKGPWETWLARYRDSVRQLDALSGQDLADFYAACDVTVLPSINWTETFGLVQVESMLCGTPVVASDLPGVREPITITGHGRLATPGDIDDLAAQLIEVLSNPERYEPDPAAVREQFSLQTTIDRYEQLYRGEPLPLYQRVSAPVPTGTEQARQRVRAALPTETDMGFRRRAETILEWVETEKPVRILDNGSGYGFILRLLRDLTNAQITGLEYEGDRVRETQEALGDDPRVSVVQGDSTALPFEREYFDYIVCSEVLEHLDDDRLAAREMMRVLKPGGTAIITVPHANYPFNWDPINWMLQRLTGKHIGGRTPVSGIWYDHQRLYTREQLISLMEGAGFEVEEVRGLTHSTFPFAHLLLYGIGKPLLRSKLVPASMRANLDRHEMAQAPTSGLMARLTGVLNRIDRRNDDANIEEKESTFLGLALRATKPE